LSATASSRSSPARAPTRRRSRDEFGNRHQAATPFVRPAWDEKQGEALEIVQRDLGEEIEKTAQRRAQPPALGRVRIAKAATPEAQQESGASAMEEDFIAALLAVAGVKALVGRASTGWSGRRVRGCRRSCCRRSPAPPLYTMAGRSDLAGHLVQVSCYGATYLAAKSVARAVTAADRHAQHRPRRPAAGRRDRERARHLRTRRRPPRRRPPPSTSFRTDLDVRVWHRG
jgi:hypothetical protein